MSKISQYTSATSLTGPETLVLVQSGNTRKIPVSKILTDPLFSHASVGSAGSVAAKLQQIISVKDAPYNAVGDGVTDDTAARDAWLLAIAGKTGYVPAGTYPVTSAGVMASNTEIIFADGAIFQTATTGISLISATSKSGIRIRGGHFKYTAGAGTAAIGGVKLDTCTHCIVEECEFEGMQWSGVCLVNSNYCTVKNNYIHDTLGTHADSNDIDLHNNSSYNLITENRCFGTSNHGILVQGPGTDIPLRNVISKNHINAKATYGIVVYQSTAADNENIVKDNTIQDIAGTGLAGASGSGIYIQTSGGCQVTGNTVLNTCISTSSTSNGPAAISVASNGAVRKPSLVSDNCIDTAHYYGIFFGDASSSGAISDNTIRYTDATNGRGINIANALKVTISGNKITGTTTTSNGIVLGATAADTSGVIINGNIVDGGNGPLINVFQSGGFKNKQGVVSNNTLIGSGASAQGISCDDITDFVINGNIVNCTATGIAISDGTRVRGSGNIVVGGGTNKYVSSGTCSDVYFDESNDFDASDTANIQNAVAGSNLTIRAAVQPASGNWQVGDRWWKTNVAAAGIPGGVCTTAGAPGTWKNMAAVAA